MSHLKKLERVLDLLINEETEQATDLLHDIVVEKARQIYEDLVDDAAMDEEFGGDIGTDYADDVAQAEDEIDTDELYNDEDQEGVVDGEVEEEEIEGRLEELESQFAELEAKFAELSGEGEEEGDSDEFGDEIDMDDDFESDEGEVEADEGEMEEDELTEATKLSNDVSIDMGKEGKLVGTGAKSKTGSLNTKSPVAGKPEASYKAGQAVKFSKGTGAGNTKPLAAKKDSGFGAKDNVDVSVKDVKADLKGEGKPVGTGKGFSKGAVNTKPVLPKK